MAGLEGANRKGDRPMSRKTFDTFDRWMEFVDHLCIEAAGIGLDDIPECPFKIWYEFGLEPFTAARRALQRVGFIL